MKTYRGKRILDTHYTEVSVNNVALPLQPSLKIRNHSPTGFEWGYKGSGPSQLALAILLDCLGDKDMALKYYHKFKGAFVSKCEDSWEITEDDILKWLRIEMKSEYTSQERM